MRDVDSDHGLSDVLATFSIPGQNVGVIHVRGDAYPHGGAGSAFRNEDSFYDVKPGDRSTSVITLKRSRRSAGTLTISMESQRSIFPSVYLGQTTIAIPAVRPLG